MTPGTLHVFLDVEQRSNEWYEQRRGIVTASAVGALVTTKTLKPAGNDTWRSLLLTLAAERITGLVEETFISHDMWRGIEDEPIARGHYAEHIDPVKECGFMLRDFGGFKLGCSPDGLVGDDGLIEIKSRLPKIQLATVLSGEVPAANMAQLQAALMVSGREWIDYVSWCGGMPMWVIRVYPDEHWFTAIYEAVATAEQAIEATCSDYLARVDGLPPTQRINRDMEIRV